VVAENKVVFLRPKGNPWGLAFKSFGSWRHRRGQRLNELGKPMGSIVIADDVEGKETGVDKRRLQSFMLLCLCFRCLMMDPIGCVIVRSRSCVHFSFLSTATDLFHLQVALPPNHPAATTIIMPLTCFFPTSNHQLLLMFKPATSFHFRTLCRFLNDDPKTKETF
jgi:hypothetical protein